MKAKLRAIDINELNGALDKFLADFPDEATRRKFLNDELDVEVWKKFSNNEDWVRKNVDLLDKLSGKGSGFIDRVSAYYVSVAKNLPKALKDVKPFKLPSSYKFNHNGTLIDIHVSKFGMPDFRSVMTPITHNGSNVAKSYKGTWNPVTTTHKAARDKDLKDATRWALEKDPIMGKLVNFPDGRVRKHSETKIAILRDGGDPINDADWVEQTWHHHENGQELLPVPTAIHNYNSHAGGFAAKHGPDGSVITPDTDITEIFR